MNFNRVPTNGRNFEYITGEDPFLGATMVYPAIKGVQSNGVIANAKHFAFNNQETNRVTVSAIVDERTRFEIYYPAFQAAVDAGVGSFMCSYNRINGVWSCENNVTLSELKRDLNFTGWVMSDWGGTHSTVLAANAGLDQEMTDGIYFNESLKEAVEAGEVSMDTLDDKVVRIFTGMINVGVMDGSCPPADFYTNATSDEHNHIARVVAANAGILLSNDNSVLPLKKNSILRVNIFGDNANNNMIWTRLR